MTIAAKSELMSAESESPVELVATGLAGATLVAVDPETVVVWNLAFSASGLAEVPTQAHFMVIPSPPAMVIEKPSLSAVTLALYQTKLSSSLLDPSPDPDPEPDDSAADPEPEPDDSAADPEAS